jgi:fermentation-respiration switch protein FrsA (DUF1100 family)
MLPVTSILATALSLSAAEAPSGDSPPPMSLEQRRQRAETLRPRLEELTDQFDARTFDAGDGEVIPYRLFKPRERKPDEKYPLVVYLHGSAGRGTDNLKQISGGNVYGSRVWALPENQAERPCFVLAPQLLQGVSGRREMTVRGEKVADAASGPPIAGKWRQVADRPEGKMVMDLVIREQGESLGGTLRMPRRGTLAVEDVSYKDGILRYTTSGGMALEAELTVEGRTFSGTLVTIGNQERAERLMALIRSLVDELAIDEDRIYVTGQSMGGAGTWGMLAYYPQFFAAAAPVCGTGDVDSAEAIARGGTAIWAFHGDADPLVPPENSRRMIAAVREAGARPKYTEYPGVKHDSWVDTYPEPELSQWMFQQRRGD